MGFQIGDKAGDYQILAVLGAGGMGQVYKVRNLISDRIEAMKVLLPNLEADPELADRFLREIKVQAALDHPNIAALHTAQRVDNQLVMIMEFVEGTSLEKMLEHGPVPMATGVDCICQVLSALAYAHAHGVIHRDIKPPNIMLTTGGQVKLMDFGIAKVAAEKRLTQTGRTVGSLYYMSPEQIKGGAELDPRSDLYSLGVTLYEVVTGRRPFQGDSDYSIMAAHLAQNPVPPIEVDSNVPSALNEIILMSIAKDPARRFQTADAFRAALESIAPLMALPVPAPDKTRMFTGNRPPVAAPAPPPVVPAPAVQTPPVQPPPVMAAPVSAASPQVSPSGSRRGLYMAIGAVAALAVLAVAVTQAPRFLRARADTETISQNQVPPRTVVQPPAQTSTEPVPQTTPAKSETPVDKPATATAAAQQPVTQPQVTQPQVTQPPATQQAATQPPATQPRVNQTPVQDPSEHYPPVRRRPVRETRVDDQPAQTPVQNSTAENPPVRHAMPENRVRENPPVQAPPAEDTRNARALSELREQYNLMAVRAGGVKAGMRSLQESMARSGQSVRGDMQTTASRMDYLMQEAMSSIRSGDVAAAHKSLDSAELALETLERWLNR